MLGKSNGFTKFFTNKKIFDGQKIELLQMFNDMKLNSDPRVLKEIN